MALPKAGAYKWYARAGDGALQSVTSTEWSFTYSPSTQTDNTPPTGAITSPDPNSYFTQPQFTVAATASDAGGSGVDNVKFYALYDNAWRLMCTDYDAPYACTHTLPNTYPREIVLSIHIADKAGNVTVNPNGERIIRYGAWVGDTTPPTGKIISPPANTQIGPGKLRIAAEASDTPSGVHRVEFFAFYDGSWRSICIDMNKLTFECEWQIPVGLTKQTVSLTIHVFDRAGNRVMDPGGYVQVNYDPTKADTTPPTGRITSPFAGARIAKGTAWLFASATAGDIGTGVSKVQFFVNSLGFAHESCVFYKPPFECSVNLQSFQQPSLSLSMRVIDVAGNVTENAGGPIAFELFDATSPTPPTPEPTTPPAPTPQPTPQPTPPSLSPRVYVPLLQRSR